MANTYTSPDQQILDRKRAIAMALQQASMQPLQAPAVHGAVVSPLEGVNKIAQALMSGYQNNQLDQQQQALTGQENAQQSQRIKALVNALSAQGTDPAKAQTIAESLTAGDPGANIGLQSILPQAPPADFTLSPGQERFSGATGAQTAAVPVTPPVPAPPSPFTLSPGQQRFGPNGEAVASVPSIEKPEPNKPLPTADVQDYQFYSEQEIKAGRTPLSFFEWQKQKANFRPPASSDQTVVVKTVDDQGNAITQIVPKVAGTTIKGAPTAQETNRREQATIVNNEANRILKMIDATPNAIGPIMGRIAKGESVVGNIPPDAKALGTALASFEALMPILHGFRGGSQVMDHFTSIIGDQHLNAAALKASIKEIQALADNIRTGKVEAENAAAPAGNVIRYDAKGNRIK